MLLPIGTEQNLGGSSRFSVTFIHSVHCSPDMRFLTFSGTRIMICPWNRGCLVDIVNTRDCAGQIHNDVWGRNIDLHSFTQLLSRFMLCAAFCARNGRTYNPGREINMQIIKEGEWILTKRKCFIKSLIQ